MLDNIAGGSKVTRRFPSLVGYCQQVLIANIDAITGFGDDMPHRLVEPILQRCNADTLSRLEQETPHLVEHNEELWKSLCARSYPLATEQFSDGDSEEPESWRNVYLHLKEEEAKRLEKAANKIRNQRLEAEEMKRKRQVVVTDRLPPPKRSRHGWSTGPAAPKTLFEKTRREATRIQKSVFGTRTLPPSNVNTKGYRPKISAPSAQLSPPKASTPITVTTVTVRSAWAPPHATVQAKEQSRSLAKSPSPHVNRPRPPALPQQEARPPPKPSGIPKKDPMAGLFLPKARAYSQLPSPDPSPHKLRSR